MRLSFVNDLFRQKISPFQHGFMENRSTVTNLVNGTQVIAENIDIRTQPEVFYPDFSKGFDKID